MTKADFLHAGSQPLRATRSRAASVPQADATRLFDAQATRTLAEVGFYAATTGHARLAKVIFRALCMDQPGSVAASLGSAVAEALSGDAPAALCILDDVECKSSSESAILHAWRGLIHHLDGRNSQGRKILSEIAHDEGPGGALARQLLDTIPRPI